jgi:hypothetical protein
MVQASKLPIILNLAISQNSAIVISAKLLSLKSHGNRKVIAAKPKIQKCIGKSSLHVSAEVVDAKTTQTRCKMTRFSLWIPFQQGLLFSLSSQHVHKLQICTREKSIDD